MSWSRQIKFHYIIVNKLYFVLIFLFLNFHLTAQEQQKRVPLVEVLEYLETIHPYKFNYLFNTIDGVLVMFPPKDISFKKAIQDLEKQTTFRFSIFKDFVSITEKENFLLCGYIKDKLTKKPISSASIQGEKNSAISNENGYFQLSTEKKTETILFRHLGYKPIKKPYHFLKKDTCNVIYLNPDVVKLKQITLSNYLVEGINKLKNGSFQINVSEFGILPGLIEPDILQTVQALPGIQSVDETVSNINIRGGGNYENLILWDGIKMYQSGHFFGLVSIFNPKMTEHVSLIKNGTSASYTDGVSGTIEMQTSNDLNTDYKISLGINFLNFDAFADVPTGRKASLQISARKGLSSFYKTPTYKSFFKRIKQNSELDTNQNGENNSNATFGFYDTSLRWLYQIDEKNQIKLSFLTLENELDFTENAMINGNNESRESKLEQISYGGSFSYKRIWNTKFESTFQIYETDYKLKGNNADITKNQSASQENKVSETGIKLNTTLKINNRLSLLSGYQFIESQVTNFDEVDNPVYSLFIAEVLRIHGFYSQLKSLSKNKKNTFISGLRANYIPKLNEFILEPRLSFNQKINDHYSFEILGELKHQTTSQIINLQNDFLGLEKRRWQLSNGANIPIIKSKQIALGLQYNNNGWLINGEGYLKKVDGITTQSQGFQNQYSLARTDGSYKVYGFDFLLRKQFKNINTWLSYTYMDSYYDFENLQNEEFHNNLDITNFVTLGAVYTFKNFKFSAGYNWHSGKPTTNTISKNIITNNQVNYEPANTNRLKDYSRLDISSTYQFNLGKKAKANLGISIWNLLNHNNIINSYYNVTNTNQIEKISQSSLNFTPNMSFRVSF